MTGDESRFLRLQLSIGKLFRDTGVEVYTGMTRLHDITGKEAKDIGSFIQEIGHMLSNVHEEHEFELQKEYLQEKYLDDPLHLSMIGFHSYHLTAVVMYLMEGKNPKESVETVKADYGLHIRD